MQGSGKTGSEKDYEQSKTPSGQFHSASFVSKSSKLVKTVPRQQV